MAAQDKRVYVLTAKGNAELTSAKTSLGEAELKLLVMIDGRATVEQIAKRMQGADVAAVAKMLQALARAGHIADPDGTAALDIKAFLKEVDSSVSSLQANGFFVRIARRASERRHPCQCAAGDPSTEVMAAEGDGQLAVRSDGQNVRVRQAHGT